MTEADQKDDPMSVKEFFAKQRSFPPVQQGVDVDAISQEIRDVEDKLRDFEDVLVRGDEREIREAREEAQRYFNAEKRKADEREKHRITTNVRARWITAIVGVIVLLIAAMELAKGYRMMRGGDGVSRSKSEEAASADSKQL